MLLPIVRALAKMTPERMNTMSEALPRILMTFLTKYCPQNPAKTDTPVRYKAAKRVHTHTKEKQNVTKIYRIFMFMDIKLMKANYHNPLGTS